MDVWRITVAALRRWYVLLPLLALSGLAAYTAGQGVAPEYEVSASAMVVPGTVQSLLPNPYGSLDEANVAVGIVVTSNESRTKIAAMGLDPEYEVGQVSRTTIFHVDVRSDTPQVGLATVTEVLDLARQELASRQQAAKVAKNATYGMAVLQAPAVGDTVAEGRTRVMAIVGVLGAGLSLLVAVVFDDLMGFARRWRTKRRAAAEARRAEASAASHADGDVGPDTVVGTEHEPEVLVEAEPGAPVEAEPDGPVEAESDAVPALAREVDAPSRVASRAGSRGQRSRSRRPVPVSVAAGAGDESDPLGQG